jgi:hypothetical protein
MNFRGLVIALAIAGCSVSDEGAGEPAKASPPDAPQRSSSNDGGNAGALVDGGTGGTSDAAFTTSRVMPLISRGVPVHSSNGSGASSANDADPATSWSSGTLPAWLAYDLSSVPLGERQSALVSFYATHAPCYIDTSPTSSGQRPLDYTIETHSAPGGGAPPGDGWTAIVTIQNSRYCGRQHLVDLNGASWVRIHVTRGSSDSSSVAFEMDVQSAPSGASDAWLFLGDSITYMTMTHAFCNLPGLVRAARPGYWPAVLDAAIGGTNTTTALAAIDDTMKDFPGRYVVLAYGTNDHVRDFAMEALVQKVLAAGKVPVVPHMPWSSVSTEGPMINQAIDGLSAKYPEIVHGPDLWAFFSGRTDLIPTNDVHPNSAGQEELRKQWAQMMVALDP